LIPFAQPIQNPEALGRLFLLTKDPYFSLTLLFSGDLFAAKRRKGRPVEGLQARNELEQFVRNLS